jgi:hypothetical protein
VEIHRDPVAVLEDGQFLDPGVEAGVVDRRRRGRGQCDRQLLVDVGEHVTRLLVGEVEVPEHLAAHHDRHAEEGPHRRMVRREPEARRVLREVR